MGKKQKQSYGLHPGAFSEIAPKITTELECLFYNQTDIEEHTVKEDYRTLFEENEKVCFVVNTNGLSDKFLKELKDSSDALNLTLEHMVEENSKAIIQDFDDYQFADLPLFFLQDSLEVAQQSVRILYWDNKVLVATSQVSWLRQLYERIQQKKGKVREKRADYLFFIVLDLITDKNFELLDSYNEAILNMESSASLSKDDFDRILHLKKQVLKMDGEYFGFHESLKKYLTDQSETVEDANWHYFEDLYQQIELLDQKLHLLNNRLDSLKELYITELTLKSNQIMQVLTIASTIFLPLTFITGLYGMNFEYIPELQYRNGYFVVLGVCFVVSVGMLLYFRKRKWL